MLRLIFSVLIFLLSLLVVVPAPTYFFWKLSIVATEAGSFFLLLCIVLLLIPWWNSGTGIVCGILNMVSLVLLSLPVISAFSTGRKLPGEIAAVFGKNLPGEKPFSLVTCFKLRSAEKFPQSLVYKKSSGRDLSLDFYAATGSGPAPCVIVIHGGSWASGDSRQIPELNSYLSERGYAVAAVNYRLAPEFTSPAPNEDLRSAIDFLKANSAELKIDSTRFVLLGRSAGGQIALLSAFTLNDKCIKGVISFYAPADMVWGYYNPGNPLVLDSRRVLNDYAGGSEEEIPARLKACSPVEFAGPGSPPALLIHGSSDIMVAYLHSIKLKDKLEQNRVKNYLLTLPRSTHGFDFFPHGPGGQLSRYAVVCFLEAVTGE